MSAGRRQPATSQLVRLTDIRQQDCRDCKLQNMFKPGPLGLAMAALPAEHAVLV